MNYPWTNISGVPTQALNQTRIALHKAVQLVGAFPRNYLPHDPTDASASLLWNSKKGAFESQEVLHQNDKIVVGLAIDAFEIYLTVNEQSTKRYVLEGSSVMGAMHWLSGELGQLGLPADSLTLNLPYKIDSYDNEEPLHAGNEALKELRLLYDNTWQSLKIIEEREEAAYDIRCWPHHFDLATLLPRAHNHEGELTKSIGIGFSPGDDAIPEPYFYINIWPNVPLAKLETKKIGMGQWSPSGWSGAYLTYQSLLDAADQSKEFNVFMGDTISILKAH